MKIYHLSSQEDILEEDIYIQIIRKSLLYSTKTAKKNNLALNRMRILLPEDPNQCYFPETFPKKVTFYARHPAHSCSWSSFPLEAT